MMQAILPADFKRKNILVNFQREVCEASSHTASIRQPEERPPTSKMEEFSDAFETQLAWGMLGLLGIVAFCAFVLVMHERTRRRNRRFSYSRLGKRFGEGTGDGAQISMAMII